MIKINRCHALFISAVMLILMLLPACAESIQADELVGDWYLSGINSDGSFMTAEELGAFMHIRLNDDSSAANITQSGEETLGIWTTDEGTLTIIFSGSAATFSAEDGKLVTKVSDGSQLVFTQELAGTYNPGSVVLAESAADFNGVWSVKWITNGSTYQSIEYLRKQYGLDTLTIELNDGKLKTDDADYGLAFSEGFLYFATDNSLSLLLRLQDDGMLCYVNKDDNVAYYCEKVQ